MTDTHSGAFEQSGAGSRAGAALPCPLCRWSSAIWLRSGDRTLHRCGRCAFLWVPQGVAASDGVSIYAQDPPIFLQDGNDEYYLDESNLWNADVKAAWVRSLAPAGTELVDVGANFGHFAVAARRWWTVTGIEPSPVAIRWAASELGVRLERGSVDDHRPDFDGRFAVATMWDVIEHLPDAGAALSVLRRYLTPGGMLFVTTPDSGSFTARLMGRHWHYLDLVQHVAIFNRTNLARLLDAFGFRIRAVRRFGRIYRSSYVKQRMAYLGRSQRLWRLAGAAAAPVLRLAPDRVTINLGDVIGIAAEAVSDPAAGSGRPSAS